MESRIQQQATSNMLKVKAKGASGKENEDRLYDESPNRRSQSERRCTPEMDECAMRSTEINRHSDESNESEFMNSWEEIQEVIESDFLISPGDIYPSRKVKLQDADVSEETLQKFESLCEEQQEAFSKNNQDIGKTQLIEMEIDTGSSVPLAQSPYH